ncbi:MAG TPA: ABC transporter permease [Terriglobales bacterium]|nr:ABC transporter permease [Terriglobales bacterium]
MRNLLTWSRRRARDLTPLLTLLVMVLAFSLSTDNFLNLVNLRNIFVQTATLAIAATGVTFVLLCAEIDLSIAAVATMTGVVAAYLVGMVGIPGVAAVVLGATVGAAAGLCNGLISTRLSLPSFMVTLATMQIASGLGQHITKGRILYTLPPAVEYLGGAYLGKHEPFRLPVVVVCGVAALLLGHFVLSYTRFGRYVYMTGSNREAARLSGVNTKNVVTVCLAVSGFTAGAAGMLNTGRLGSAQGFGMENMLLDSIAAVVLGGTSLFGGEGGIKNTAIGLLIFGVLNNGLNLLQLDIFVRLWLRGIVLLAALLINVYALHLRKKTA